jgi:hypothetical protein
MNKRFKFLVYAILFTIAQIGSAQKYINEFLSTGLGARSFGMSKSVVASDDYVTAAYWNPAGLANVEAPFQVSAMHASLFGNIYKFDFITLGKTVNPSKNGFGALTIMRGAIDDIPNTLELIGPDGSIDYNRITYFSNADYCGMISYGQNLKKIGWTAGGSLKIIRRTFGKFASSWGFGADLGLRYRNENWLAGATFRDITTTYNTWKYSFTEEEKNVLISTGNTVSSGTTELARPSVLLGGGYRKQFKRKFGILIETNLECTFDGQRNTLIASDVVSIDPSIGFEVDFSKKLFIRAGAHNFQQVLSPTDNTKKTWTVQPSVGIGLQFGKVHIDYAFANFGSDFETNYSHIVSASLDFKNDEKNK